MMGRVVGLWLAGGLLCMTGGKAVGQVVSSEWNVGNGNWNVPTNWFPNAAPDNGGGFTFNVQIGNRAVAANAQVTFVPKDGASDTMTSLSISGGADLLTNGNQLEVLGQTTVAGTGSSIRADPPITPGTPALSTKDLDLNDNGVVLLQGGVIVVNGTAEINPTGVIEGFGGLTVGDSDATATQAFENSGRIAVSGSTVAPQVLSINAAGGAMDTIDLDGETEAGVLQVNNAATNLNADVLTLVIDAPLSDPFSGAIQIGQRDTLFLAREFAMNGATVALDGGNQIASLAGTGSITTIESSLWTISGRATISNNLNFVGTDNSITVGTNASLTLNGGISLPDASALVLGSGSQLIIGGTTAITDFNGDFDWDGGPASTTVQGNGFLSLIVKHIDANNSDQFDGTLNLNDQADVSVLVAAPEWQLGGVINKNNVGTSTITGDRLAITGAGVVNVHAGVLEIPFETVLASGSRLTVDAGATVTLGKATVNAGAVVTVNGTMGLAQLEGPTTIAGSGLVRFNGGVTIGDATTIDAAAFDWDGTVEDNVQTIKNGAVLTINSATWDADDAGDVDDAISLGGGGGQLIVNNVSSWTMTRMLTANPTAAGTATIGGTSRFVLSGASATLAVKGNTNITAPVTFGAGSTTTIDAGMTLDAGATARYDGGTIGGSGVYSPAAANAVAGNSTINVATFDFDAGSWDVEAGGSLTVNVGDYDPVAATNAFDGAIRLDNGDVSLNTADARFVMDGALAMNSTAEGQVTLWSGEPLDIGNDAGVLDADLVVSGTKTSQFDAPVDFRSDADVRIDAVATLVLNGAVNFQTVNGVSNASFTGAGTLAFNRAVNVVEAVTLNMPGGAVDLDGIDDAGDVVKVDAPLVINAQSMGNFGRANSTGGANTLEINNNVVTGSLTVTLDNANGEWTLNAPGVMNLVNDNATSVLLAGADVNLEGTVNVTGDVQIDARVDLAGTVTINTAGEPLRLNGGKKATDPNTMARATISGAGLLSANSGRALQGSGTINANVDFAADTALRADNGMLTINGTIVHVDEIGTADVDGVLNVANAWNSNVATLVTLRGGELKGGALTIGNADGVQGVGRVSSKIINNTRLRADIGTLVVETAPNDNDWDGSTNTGVLSAVGGGTLELRDNADFAFAGTVAATAGSRVFANNFALDFNPGSTINLTGSKYQSTNKTDLGGDVNVAAGAASTIEIQVNRFLNFEATSVTTLNGDLTLVSNNINVAPEAKFSGPGALIIENGSNLSASPGANINVLLDNRGDFRPGGVGVVGRVDARDYQQSSIGKLFVELTGKGLNQFDRLIVNGEAQIDGSLEVQIDGGFVPALGNTFGIIAATTRSGTFHDVAVLGMPAGLTLHVNYLPNAVQLQVVNAPTFSADFDDDGDVDASDLAVWRGAFQLSPLGDADGDLDSDGNDFLLWQRQLAAAPAAVNVVPVPEPATLGLLALALGMTARSLRKRRGC